MILYLNLLTSLIMTTTDTASSPRFTPQDLPYAYDALAPAISEETMHYHHDKHYAGYVDKLNELIVDTPFAGQPLEDIILSADGPVYNNAAQAWNHAFFFGQLSPKPQKEPSGELLVKLSVRAKRLGDQVAGARQFDSDDGLFLGFAHVGLYIYVETGTSLT